MRGLAEVGVCAARLRANEKVRGYGHKTWTDELELELKVHT
jgi:hypothetical protein